MGWKNVKEHYRIGHIVQVVEDKGICIGSGYVSDLIVIDPKGRTVKPGLLGISGKDLMRYWDEIHADLPKLWELIEAPDTFERSLPVFTYRDGEILAYVCEDYDWPNITHEGAMMYDNRFFQDRDKALERAKEHSKASIEMWEQSVKDLEKKLAEYHGHLNVEKANLAKYEQEKTQ